MENNDSDSMESSLLVRNNYLLENDPIKWETHIHYFHFWSFVIGNVGFLVLGAILNFDSHKSAPEFGNFMKGSFGFTFFVAHIVLLFYAFYQTYLPSQPVFYTPSQFFKRFFLFFGAIGFIFLNGFVFVFGGSLTYLRFDIVTILYANIDFVIQNFPYALAFGFLFSMVMLVCRELNFNNLLVSFGIIFCFHFFTNIITFGNSVSVNNIFDLVLIGIALIFSLMYNRLPKTAFVILFNVLFLQSYVRFWFFNNKLDNLVIFPIQLIILMLLTFNLNQMSAFPKKSSLFINFKNHFSFLKYIKNAIFSPFFLKKIDKYLIVKNPILWETKVHYIVYYFFILGNIFLFLFQNYQKQNNNFLSQAITYYWWLSAIFYVVYQTYFNNYINYYTPNQTFWRFVGVCIVAGCFFSNCFVASLHIVSIEPLIKSNYLLAYNLSYNFSNEFNAKIYFAFLSALFFLISKNNTFSMYLTTVICAFFLTIFTIIFYVFGVILFLAYSFVAISNAIYNIPSYKKTLIIIQNLAICIIFLGSLVSMENQVIQIPFGAIIGTNFFLIGLFFYLNNLQNEAKYSPEESKLNPFLENN